MFDFNQKPDLNITPLVDIMLVLLAILMVTAPVIEFEEPINLPTGSKSQQSQDVAKIDIIITKDRIVTLNKNKVEISNFADNFLLLYVLEYFDLYLLKRAKYSNTYKSRQKLEI